MKKSIVLTTAVAAALTSSVAAAEVTANAAFVSNYIWRGITQTIDSAAGQGGIDWGHESGLYVGTWVSNIDFSGDFGFGYEIGNGYEADIYAGFAGEVGSLGYDLGVITYQYPVTPNISFTEVYVSATASIVTVGVNYTVDAGSANKDLAFDNGDMYFSGSLDFPLGKTDLSIYAGAYKFENDGITPGYDVDYSHFGASISKDGFYFALDKNDVEGGNADNIRASVGYGIDFEL